MINRDSYNNVVLPKERKTHIQLENGVLKFPVTERSSKNRDSYKVHEWDLKSQLILTELLKDERFSEFNKMAEIVSDENVAPGYRISATDNFVDKTDLIYLCVIDGRVVKGGKSKNVISSRTYGAGTEFSWSNTGKASPVNYIFSQIFRQAVEDGVKIEFYGYSVQPTIITNMIFGKLVTQKFSPYESHEIELNSLLREIKKGKLIGERDLESQFKY